LPKAIDYTYVNVTVAIENVYFYKKQKKQDHMHCCTYTAIKKPHIPTRWTRLIYKVLSVD